MNYFNYFSEIEDAFVRRRGKHLIISSRDWTLIEAWLDRGIPLHIVIRAIDVVFDERAKRPGEGMISSLGYCKGEVERQFLGWSASQVGKSGELRVESRESVHA